MWINEIKPEPIDKPIIKMEHSGATLDKKEESIKKLPRPIKRKRRPKKELKKILCKFCDQQIVGRELYKKHIDEHKYNREKLQCEFCLLQIERSLMSEHVSCGTLSELIKKCFQFLARTARRGNREPQLQVRHLWQIQNQN